MELLIDADILLYQMSCINEVTYTWDEDTVSEVNDLEAAIAAFDDFVKTLVRHTETEKAVLCFSDTINFRYSVLPSYKHNRQEKAKPTLMPALKRHALLTWESKTKPGLEADDVLGILGTLRPGQYVIASLDKDLLQIPGKSYNWRKDLWKDITLEQADRWFYQQVLTGDSTDGYSGCPGIGPVRAEVILDSAEDKLWPAIVTAYESRGLTEADALVQARVARILRATDYDFKKKEPILWEP